MMKMRLGRRAAVAAARPARGSATAPAATPFRNSRRFIGGGRGYSEYRINCTALARVSTGGLSYAPVPAKPLLVRKLLAPRALLPVAARPAHPPHRLGLP